MRLDEGPTADWLLLVMLGAVMAIAVGLVVFFRAWWGG